MSVTPVSAANDVSTTTSAASSKVFGNNQLDMNAFLTLFLTQLKYQDPTNPMESYELASQLAQFSSVEKLTDINANLTNFQSSLSSLANAQMIGVIGKNVVAQANTLQMTGGTSTNAEYQFELESGGTANVSITIYDENGNLVRTKTLNSQAAGRYKVDWDGCDDANKKVNDGTYSFKVEALDGNGNALDVASTVSGMAYSFRLEQGGQYLILDGADGIKVPVSNLIEVTSL